MARFLEAFTDDLVQLELGPLPDDLRDGARTWVRERVAGAGAVSRAGIAIAGLILATAVRLATGRGYAQLPGERRRAIARRLAASRLPIAGEYAKLVRSLTVVYVFEAGTA